MLDTSLKESLFFVFIKTMIVMVLVKMMIIQINILHLT